MNVALIVVVSLVITVPVVAAAGYMAWASHRARQADLAKGDAERSVSTEDGLEPRLRDLAIESLRKKRSHDKQSLSEEATRVSKISKVDTSSKVESAVSDKV